MVGNNTHGNVVLFIFAIFRSGHLGNCFNQRLEYVRVVIGCFTLQSHAQAFESHTGIDHFRRKRLKSAVGFAVVLHEYKIPDFDNLGMIVVHQVAS